MIFTFSRKNYATFMLFAEFMKFILLNHEEHKRFSSKNKIKTISNARTNLLLFPYKKLFDDITDPLQAKLEYSQIQISC